LKILISGILEPEKLEELAQRMMDFGKTHNSENLQHFGRSVFDYSRQFDIVNLEKQWHLGDEMITYFKIKEQ